MVMTVMTNLIVVHQLSDAKSLGPRFPANTPYSSNSTGYGCAITQSALALWALARKLLVALRKYVTVGVVNGEEADHRQDFQSGTVKRKFAPIFLELP